MPRVPTRLYVGGRRVAVENRHLLGPVEGTWWKVYSIPVVVLGLIFLLWLAWPRIFGASNPPIPPPPAAPPALVPAAPPPTVVAPVVVQAPPVHVTVQAPPAPTPPAPTAVESPKDPTAGMTPEERRQYEIWVLRK